MRKSVLLSVLIVLIIVSGALASDYEITGISAIFNEATPGFGEFKIEVGILNKVHQERSLIVSCLYTGFTRPGVYFKNEPQIMIRYKMVKIGPGGKVSVKFEKGFRSYHPETKGEIIVSIVGSGVVNSIPLKTSFHPKSND